MGWCEVDDVPEGYYDWLDDLSTGVARVDAVAQVLACGLGAALTDSRWGSDFISSARQTQDLFGSAPLTDDWTTLHVDARHAELPEDYDYRQLLADLETWDEAYAVETDPRDPDDWRYWSWHEGATERWAPVNAERARLTDAVTRMLDADDPDLVRLVHHAVALLVKLRVHHDELASGSLSDRAMLIARLARMRGRLQRAASLARKAGDHALADLLDALATGIAVVAEQLAAWHPVVALVPRPRTLAPPGRAPTAVPILANAPPVTGVSVAA